MQWAYVNNRALWHIHNTSVVYALHKNTHSHITKKNAKIFINKVHCTIRHTGLCTSHLCSMEMVIIINDSSSPFLYTQNKIKIIIMCVTGMSDFRFYVEYLNFPECKNNENLRNMNLIFRNNTEINQKFTTLLKKGNWLQYYGNKFLTEDLADSFKSFKLCWPLVHELIAPTWQSL